MLKRCNHSILCHLPPHTLLLQKKYAAKPALLLAQARRAQHQQRPFPENLPWPIRPRLRIRSAAFLAIQPPCVALWPIHELLCTCCTVWTRPSACAAAVRFSNLTKPCSVP